MRHAVWVPAASALPRGVRRGWHDLFCCGARRRRRLPDRFAREPLRPLNADVAGGPPSLAVRSICFVYRQGDISTLRSPRFPTQPLCRDVPLLNGIDPVGRLRRATRRARVPATISIVS